MGTYGSPSAAAASLADEGLSLSLVGGGHYGRQFTCSLSLSLSLSLGKM